MNFLVIILTYFKSISQTTYLLSIKIGCVPFSSFYRGGGCLSYLFLTYEAFITRGKTVPVKKKNLLCKVMVIVTVC